MFPCTNRSLTRSKEVPFPCIFLSCSASLPESLPGRVTPYPISYRGAYLDSYPILCPIPYPSRYLEPHPSRYLSRTRSFSRVLPGHVSDRVNSGLTRALTQLGKILPDHVPGHAQGLPGRVTFTRLRTRLYPIFLPDRVTSC
jgi:hypothetical protein